MEKHHNSQTMGKTALVLLASLAALCGAEPSGLGGVGFKKGYQDGYDETFGSVNKFQGGAGGEFDKGFFEKGGQAGEKGYKG